MKTKKAFGAVAIIAIVVIVVLAIAALYIGVSRLNKKIIPATEAKCGNGVTEADEVCDISGCKEPAICTDDCTCIVPNDDNIPKPPKLPV